MRGFLSRHGLEICFAAILLFTGVLKLPSLRVPHQEYDERIYVALAGQVAHQGRYSLRGTELLKELAPEIYDRPLFFQPPLFVLLSIPLTEAFGDHAAVVLSWAGHFMVLGALFLFLRRLLGRSPLAILLIVSLAAFDPILVFASRKIWTDALTAGFGAVSLYLFWAACGIDEGSGKTRRLVFSGIFLGAAVMTRVPAALLGPFYVLLHFRYHGSQAPKKQLKFLAAALIPALVISLPWFLITFLKYGTLIDIPVLPGHLVQTNSYVHMVTSRPFWYYLREIVLITPIILFPFFHSLQDMTHLSFFSITLWITVLSVIGGYTCFAVLYHQPYVMRYMTLLGLPSYLLLGLYLENRILSGGSQERGAGAGGGGDGAGERSRGVAFGPLYRYTLCFLALGMNAMTDFYFLEHHVADELFSLFEILRGVH